MSVLPPRLDDADTATLLTQAQKHLEDTGSRWRANDPADPGLALLEAFAAITGEELGRLNRLPEALLGRYLHMLGVTLNPARAASATVTFSLGAPRAADTLIPAGLRVTSDTPDAAVFRLTNDVHIAPGADRAQGVVSTAIEVPLTEAATATGKPGQQISLAHNNLPGQPAEVADIQLFVRWPTDPPPNARSELRDGSHYVHYDEMIGADPGEGDFCFVADRAAGTIRLPSQPEFVPPAGTQILAQYFYLDADTSNGAEGGQISALGSGLLTQILDPAPGLSVNNLAPVTMGEPMQRQEDLLNHGALAGLLGGQAVRPRDYEELARRAPTSAARAHAFTEAEIWQFAERGKVSLRLAPPVDLATIGDPEDSEGAQMLWHEALESAQRDPLLGQQMLKSAQERLDAACPLGASVDVSWLKAKPVGVSATVYVTPGTSHPEMAQMVRRHLDAYLAPVPGGHWPDGWPCGRTLRQSYLIETLQEIEGVRSVDRVTIHPRYPMSGATTALAADAHQNTVWFAAIGGILYVTMNNGEGWTMCQGHLDDSEDAAILSVATHPVQSGLVAAATRGGDILVSRDCGRTFLPFAKSPFAPTLMAWADGGEAQRLLVGGAAGDLGATDGPDDEGNLPQIAPLHAQDGIVGRVTAIATRSDGQGGRLVAAARSGLGGIVFSNDSGWDGGFFPSAPVNGPAAFDPDAPKWLGGHDVRSLAFMTAPNGDLHLVAGCAKPMVSGQSAVLIAPVDVPIGSIGQWRPANVENWRAGSVLSLAAFGSNLVAGVASGGLRFATLGNNGRLTWTDPDQDAGLPTGETHRSAAPISALAIATMPPDEKPPRPPRIAIGGDGALAMAGSAQTLSQRRWADSTVRAGAKRIAIPDDWVICGDRHQIEVRDVLD